MRFCEIQHNLFFIIHLDFTKRRFIAYNPRYDLDLLIVPPPILASDFVKGGGNPQTGSSMPTTKEGGAAKVPSLSPPQPPHTPTNGDFLNEQHQRNQQRSALYGRAVISTTISTFSPKSNVEEEDVFTTELKIADDDDDDGDDTNNNNNTDSHDDNNNKSLSGKNNNNNSWSSNKTNYYTPKGVSVLPSIKEEARSKLEDQINKLRNGQEAELTQHSPFSDNNNNENVVSPINLASRHRPKQHCT